MTIAQGSTLAGRYRLTGVLAVGGMAEVYRGEDLAVGREVAVKVVRGSGGATLRRFDREIATLSRLDHPGIVRLLEAGEHDGQPYFVMELVEGTDLQEQLVGGALEPEDARRIGADVAAALASAHEHGVVHRDVKPSNILIDYSGRARLADFGIARFVDRTAVTATGVTVGTAAYLAPEQVGGGGVGPEADVYSLGLVLLELLTGHPPFEGTSNEVLFSRVTRDPEIPPHLPRPWARLLVAMTAREPAARPTAARVRDVLEAGFPPGRTETLELPAPDADAAETTVEMRGGTDATAADVHDRGGDPLVDAAPRGRPRRGRRAGWRRVTAYLLAAGLVAAALVAGFLADRRPAPDTGTGATVEDADGAGLPPALDDAIDRLEEAVQP